MSKTLAKELQPSPARILAGKAGDVDRTATKAAVAEKGSPFDYYGCGPHLKRLTTWEPERWQVTADHLAAGLHPRYHKTMRFHTWKDRNVMSLAQAYHHAKDFARGNLTWGNFLVLAGSSGVGKTHLAAAIAWEWLEDGCDVIFTRVDDLLDDLRRSYANDTYHKKLERFKQCALLVLDDLGTEHAREWAGEKIDRIVDYRYVNHLTLVVTTSAKSKNLAPRVASRLKDMHCGIALQIEAEDYRQQAGQVNDKTGG